MAKKQVKGKSKPSGIKNALTGVLVVLVLLVIAYCIGWGVTGSYNPVDWGNGNTEEAAASVSGSPIEDGGAGSAQALSSEASAQSDDKAAFNTAVNQWVSDNDPEDDSDDGAYEDWRTHDKYTVNNVIIQRTTDGATFKLNELNTNFACIANEFCSGGGAASYESYYYVIIRDGNVFPDMPNTNFTSSVAGFTEKSKFDYLDYQMLFVGSRHERDDGTVDDNTEETITITYTADESRIPLPDDPVKEGYTFVGWYLDEALTQPYDGQPITADTQLYAKFVANQYTVSFDTDGGTELEAITVDYNTAPELSTPEKTGYNFVGWFLSDGAEYDGAAITEDTTLTAHWEIKTFTVTFYVNGEVYKTVTVEYGARLGKIADVAEVFENNILSFANVNTETPELAISAMTVSDDMIVVAKEPSTFEKVYKYKYTPYIIGGVCLIVALGVIVTVIEKKKKQG